MDKLLYDWRNPKDSYQKEEVEDRIHNLDVKWQALNRAVNRQMKITKRNLEAKVKFCF